MRAKRFPKQPAFQQRPAQPRVVCEACHESILSAADSARYEGKLIHGWCLPDDSLERDRWEQQQRWLKETAVKDPGWKDD